MGSELTGACCYNSSKSTFFLMFDKVKDVFLGDVALRRYKIHVCRYGYVGHNADIRSSGQAAVRHFGTRDYNYQHAEYVAVYGIDDIAGAD